MNRVSRKLLSERGAMRPVQYILIGVLLMLLYCAVMYSPSLLHQMAMSTVADEAAARMNVERSEPAILKQIVDQAGVQNVHIGPHNVELHWTDPAAGGKNTVVIRWEEQVEHLWGRTQTLQKRVKAKAGVGELAGVAGGKK